MNSFTKVTLVLPNLSSIQSINEPADIVNGPGVQALSMGSILLNMIHGISIWKVTVCSPLLVAAIFVVGSIRTIGFCRPGASSWFMSKLGNGKSIVDIAFYEGKFYAIDFSDLFAISIGNDDDPGEPRVSHIVRVIEGPPLSFTGDVNFLEPSHILVEYHGALIRVCREAYYKESYPCEATGKHMLLLDIKILLFEADIHSSQWVEMKSMGDDTALFTDRGCSQSVCVSQYKPWGNCIFFLDDGTWSWFWKQQQWSCCMYSMRDDEFYSPPEAAGMSKKGPGAWLFPQL